jgi:hypothetical protein
MTHTLYRGQWMTWQLYTLVVLARMHQLGLR